MLKESILEKNKQMLQSFLIDKKIDKSYKLDDQAIPFGFIYCIENINNKKKYIGSVYSVWVANQRPLAYTQLRKRASNYLYEYNCAMDTTKNTATKQNRPVIQAMVDDGFENFIMYPIAETTRDTHIAAENYFINTLDTIASGYNVIKASSSFRKDNNPIGKKLSAEDKKARSEAILCINMNDKKLLMSDSMKLFGDYMGSSKDMIKNCNRMGRPYKGWFIFYIDPDKRAYILDNNVLGDKMLNVKRSDKSKNFYKTLYGIVTLYLRSNANKEFFPEFEILTPLEYKEKL